MRNTPPTPSPLPNAHILLGITGGIACYKSADLCRRFTKAGAQVQVIMTTAAARFVAPLTFQTLSGRPVYIDMFEPYRAWEIEHISYARWGHILVIAPATANTIAKIAGGIADNPLTTTVLAFRGPVLIVPAMNTSMWENSQTQRNIQTLRSRGIHFLQPDAGLLACGEVGAGRMPDADEILVHVSGILSEFRKSGPLAGKKVLITAGPTVEPIDPVRFISNASTGKTGYALAAEAARRGAAVTLVTGPTYLAPPGNVMVINVQTAQQMHDAVLAHLAEQDICIFSAAVSDFTPEVPSAEKIKKDDSQNITTLTFVRTPDVAKAANAHRVPGQYFVGFAAETSNLVSFARGKMQAKGYDMMVANLVSAENPAFGVDENAVTILTKSSEQQLPKMLKDDLAIQIWNRIVEEKKESGE